MVLEQRWAISGHSPQIESCCTPGIHDHWQLHSRSVATVDLRIIADTLDLANQTATEILQQLTSQNMVAHE